MPGSNRKPSRLKRLLQNLALSAASILLLLIVLESVLTLFNYGKLIIYEPDDKLYWRPKPNQSCYTKVGRRPVTINAQRTRGEDFSPEKPDGVFRVLCVGDSRTYGWGVADSETYPAILQDSLRALAGDRRRVEVINAGVNGWSWSQVFVYLRDVGLAYSPDVVVVADAYSFTSFTEDRCPEFIRRMKRRVRLKNWLRKSAIYHYFIEYKFREAHVRLKRLVFSEEPKPQAPRVEVPAQDDPDYLYYQTYITKVCELIHRQRVECILLHLPVEGESAGTRPSAWALKKEASRRYNMTFVDVTDDFLAESRELFLDRDPLHQNAAANRIIAHRLFERLKSDLLLQ